MNKIIKNTIQTFVISTSAVAMVACGSSDGSFASSSNNNSGTVNLNITDAAVDDASKVMVMFTGVSLKPKDGDVVEFNFDKAKSIDLLALQNGEFESLLASESLPAGEYSWVRLAVEAQEDVIDSYISLSESDHSLYIPSGSESGLKLNSGFIVPENAAISLTIDFDLRKSIVKPTNKDYKLKPSLRLVDNSEVGSFVGTIDANLFTGDQCSDYAAVYVYQGSDVTADDVGAANNAPLSSAMVAVKDSVYKYTAAFLTAGDYTLAFTCQADANNVLINDDPEMDDEIIFIGTQNATIIADKEVTVDF